MKISHEAGQFAARLGIERSGEDRVTRMFTVHSIHRPLEFAHWTTQPTNHGSGSRAAGGGMVLPNGVQELLEVIGALSVLVSLCVGLTAIVLDARDRLRSGRVESR